MADKTRLEKAFGLSFEHYHKSHLSICKSLQQLVNKILEAKSKQQEDKVLREEIKILKDRMQSPNLSSHQMRDCLIEVIYATVRHYGITFAHIHAIKFTQQPTLKEKRIGYLAISCLLTENHELLVLLVNTLQKDLSSTNFVENCMALSTIASLISLETMPAIAKDVEKKLSHTREAVRKRAVIAMLKFYRLSPELVDLVDKLRHAVLDSDFSVITAAVTAYLCLAKKEPNVLKSMTKRFVDVLSQTLAHKPPTDLSYRGISAPWLQIKLLKLLAYVGADDKHCSQIIYPVIEDSLMSIKNPNSLIEYAIIYESIVTATAIYPNSRLLEKAAQCVSKFLSSQNNNLRYIGIKGLTSIMQVNPLFATEHQITVVDCLDDPDETLRRKTLDLLCRMTNPKNIVFVTGKLLNCLQCSGDNYFKSDLVLRICQLAEKFAPDSFWYIKTMNSVLDLGGDCVPLHILDNVLRLIAEGTGDDEADLELRIFAVHEYLNLMNKSLLPAYLIRAVAWVVGEYAYLLNEIHLINVMDNLCNLAELHVKESTVNACLLVTSVLKLIARSGQCSEYTRQFLEKYSNSIHVDLQQRCQEALQVLATLTVDSMANVLPTNASCEDIEVDSALNFLCSYVKDALDGGSLAYTESGQRKSSLQRETRSLSTLKFTPYTPPTEVIGFDKSGINSSNTSGDGDGVHDNTRIVTGSFPTQDAVSKAEESTVRCSRPWTKEGYMMQSQSSNQNLSGKSNANAVSPIAKAEQKELTQGSEDLSSLKLEKKKRLASALFVGFNEGDGDLSITTSAHAKRTIHGHSIIDTDGSSSSATTINESLGNLSVVDKIVAEEDLIKLPMDGQNDTSFDATAIIKEEPRECLVNVNDNSLIDPIEDPSMYVESSDTIPSNIVSKATPSVNVTQEDNSADLNLLAKDIIPKALLTSRHSNLNVVSTSFHSGLRVALMKIWKQDSFMVAFIMTNLAELQLTDINLVVQPSSNLQCLVEDKIVDSPTFTDNLKRCASTLHLLDIVQRMPALNVSIDGNISFPSPTTNSLQRYFFNYPLTVFDLVRPFHMKTDEFAQKWMAMSHEHKQQATSCHSTLSDCKNVLETNNMHVVEVIGNEIICSGRLIKSSTTILIHSRVDDSVIQIWVKSNNSALMSQSIAHQLCSVLNS